MKKIAAKKITKNMSIMEILQTFPEHREKLAETLAKSGLHCLGCSMARFETLEEGVLAHGMSKKDVNEIVKKLNDAVAK